MPSARARRRGDFLNCWFAVSVIQNADVSRVAGMSARLFMAEHLKELGKSSLLHWHYTVRARRHCKKYKGAVVMLQRRRCSAAITLVIGRSPYQLLNKAATP